MVHYVTIIVIVYALCNVYGISMAFVYYSGNQFGNKHAH